MQKCKECSSSRAAGSDRREAPAASRVAAPRAASPGAKPAPTTDRAVGGGHRPRPCPGAGDALPGGGAGGAKPKARGALRRAPGGAGRRRSGCTFARDSPLRHLRAGAMAGGAHAGPRVFLLPGKRAPAGPARAGGHSRGSGGAWVRVPDAPGEPHAPARASLRPGAGCTPRARTARAQGLPRLRGGDVATRTPGRGARPASAFQWMRARGSGASPGISDAGMGEGRWRSPRLGLWGGCAAGRAGVGLNRLAAR